MQFFKKIILLLFLFGSLLFSQSTFANDQTTVYVTERVEGMNCQCVERDDYDNMIPTEESFCKENIAKRLYECVVPEKTAVQKGTREIMQLTQMLYTLKIKIYPTYHDFFILTGGFVLKYLTPWIYN